MTPYPAYRDTGFAAVPHMPKHWNIKKFRHVAQLMQRKNRDDVERPMLSLSAYRGIEIKQYEDDNLTRSKEESLEYHVVEPGQLVVNPMWVIYGAIGVSQLCGIVSPAYRVYKLSRDISPAYCDLLLRSHFYVAEYNRYVRGLTTYDRSVRKEDFHEIPVLLPPRDEQDAIVAYLGRKLAEIDRFIAAKERLIALLCEQKAAIINRAVTRGLDPDVPMRPSGIEWLGEIPAHWKVVRNKVVFREVNERSETGLEIHLSMSQRLGLVPTSRIEERTLQSEDREGFKLCQVDDLVLNRLKAHLGVFARATMSGLVSPDYTVFRLRVEADVQYFELLYRHPAYIAAFNMAVRGIVVGFLRLYTPEFYDIHAVVPPHEEQKRIIQFIDTESVQIDAAITRAEREIELIKEFRTTLIADAVTGKIDVRSAVPAIAEEVPV